MSQRFGEQMMVNTDEIIKRLEELKRRRSITRKSYTNSAVNKSVRSFLWGEMSGLRDAIEVVRELQRTGHEG